MSGLEKLVVGAAIAALLGVLVEAFTLGIAEGVVKAWVRLYTAWLPADIRDGRRLLIESDIWDHKARAREQGYSPKAIGAQMLLRLVFGLHDDVLWSLRQLRLFGRLLDTLDPMSFLQRLNDEARIEADLMLQAVRDGKSGIRAPGECIRDVIVNADLALSKHMVALLLMTWMAENLVYFCNPPVFIRLRVGIKIQVMVEVTRRLPPGWRSRFYRLVERRVRDYLRDDAEPRIGRAAP